ncbi:MAG: DNA mismatch repair endonuclease MutL [Candidatus Thermoplasmatota archaeon]|nr:DNA mismatch repair endonuclease MutL [Candidatus Thermoplasmatota archaeon]
MVRRIRVLDDSTVRKIAAGEAVESPASVVKELLENSLDARAKNIAVRLDGGGIGRIMVSDDGCGMSREDAEVAFLRHSTSKLSSIEDLSTIGTLGFRGEALASISAISSVEMVTRERGSVESGGTRIILSFGRIAVLEEVGCPEGTTITVSDLFANVPARKKFLKSVQTERSRCMDVVSRAMLSRPDVGFRAYVDDQLRFESPPCTDLRDRAAAVLGPKVARALLELPDRSYGSVRVTGLISLPWESRSTSAGITVSVRGRVVRNRNIVDALRRGYGSRLMKGRYPLVVMDLVPPSECLDVNVHPAKELVKFSEERAVLLAVETAVSDIVFSRKAAFPKQEGTVEEGAADRIERPPPPPAMVKVISSGPGQSELPVALREMERTRSEFDEVPSMEGPESLPPALPEDASAHPLRIIGQLDRSYILCELGSDLLMVDQHAAHERVRLEELKKRYITGKVSTQELLDPVHIELDQTSIDNLGVMGSALKELGFLFEDFGPSSIVVRGLPRFMGRMEGHEVIRDLLSGVEVHEGCSPPDPSFMPELPLKEKIIALTACRGAIKAHHGLSLREMEDLIRTLLECEVPLHCAHGRPTMIRLPQSILERWFRRVL